MKTSENIVMMRDMAAVQDESFEDGVGGSEAAARSVCFVAAPGCRVASPYYTHVVVSLFVVVRIEGHHLLPYWAGIRIIARRSPHSPLHSCSGCPCYTSIITIAVSVASHLCFYREYRSTVNDLGTKGRSGARKQVTPSVVCQREARDGCVHGGSSTALWAERPVTAMIGVSAATQSCLTD